MKTNTLIRPAAVGAIGGLAATAIMDVFCIAPYILLASPDVSPFAIIGESAAGGFRLIGIRLAGGAGLGAACHYVIGAAMGAVGGAAAARFEALRLTSAIKAVGLGILYVQLASLPLLAGAAIILKMTPAGTGLWFGMSFVMHLVYGAALGLIVRYGLRPRPVTRRA